MKKSIILLTLLLMTSFATVADASELRYLPETDLITCGKHFEVLDADSPEGTTPVWVIDNPSCYNKQEIKLGTIETRVDDKTNMVYVYQNGVLTKEYHIKYEASLDFDFEAQSGGE